MPMFSVYKALFTIVFVVVLGTILITVIRNPAMERKITIPLS